MMLTPRPGMLVAGIEGLKFKSDPPAVQKTRAIAATHRVAAPFPRASLLKKRD